MEASPTKLNPNAMEILLRPSFIVCVGILQKIIMECGTNTRLKYYPYFSNFRALSFAPKSVFLPAKFDTKI